MYFDIYTAIAVLIISLLGYLSLKKKYSTHAFGTTDRPDLLGPSGSFLMGNLPYVSKNTDRLLEVFVNWRKTYGLGGTFTLPFFRIIDISKPDWIEYVQKTNFKNYVKGETSSAVMKDVLGAGIFATDGDKWYVQRKTTSHIFTSNSFRGIITTSISDHLKIFIDFLKKASDEKNPVALNELFFRMTLDTFVKMAFGRDINSLRNGKSVPFAEAFDYAQNQINWRFLHFYWVISELFSSNGRKMKEAVKVIDDFAYKIIDQRAQEKQRVDEDSTDLLSLYLKMKDEDGNPLSRDEVKHAIINLVIAGRDTTAQTLSWAFYYLIRDQKFYQKVRDEVKEVEEVNYDNYKRLVYTNAVFSEALRLHPAVPKNIKQCVSDDQLPDGPKVYKGEWVRWSDWQMARDPTVWGEDCTEFKPERWIDEKGNYVRVDSWKFHSFNGGPRLCLGVNLATYEAVATLAALVKNFDMKFAPGWYENVEKISGYGYEEDTPVYASSVTLPMKHNMMVLISSPSS
eukprot:TRINITY_DN3122_c0_g1_i1.p1 TRINITY_DN3122_c0_g1~~TRINITY_DN3122_c0_g1_i1.p1  ORF type:complete len:512 (+),score=127.97 TRINITY_DN3122_c0_g1_i1:48-1583(+)